MNGTISVALRAAPRARIPLSYAAKPRTKASSRTSTATIFTGWPLCSNGYEFGYYALQKVMLDHYANDEFIKILSLMSVVDPLCGLSTQTILVLLYAGGCGLPPFERLIPPNSPASHKTYSAA